MRGPNAVVPFRSTIQTAQGTVCGEYLHRKRMPLEGYVVKKYGTGILCALTTFSSMLPLRIRFPKAGSCKLGRRCGSTC